MWYVDKAIDPENAGFAVDWGVTELGFEEMSISFISKSDYSWNQFAMYWCEMLFRYQVNTAEQMYL